MTESTQATLLRRMTRSQETDVVDNPLTSSRAVRLALTKAANNAAGLVLTVTSVAQDVSTLDEVLDGLPDGLMLVGLHRQGQLVGLIALDMQLRAAVLEMETMGSLSATTAEDRVPTHTDKVLCEPLIAAFLAAFPEAVRGTAFEGWGDGITHDDRIKDARMAGLLLDDCPYRLVQMNVQLGAADRQGALLMLLPLIESPRVEVMPDKEETDWKTQFPKAVQDAPAALTALLHKFSVPLATARALGVGTVLPLPGCRVSSVRLVAPDGQEVAQAKLGQSGGMRAVRLQSAPAPDLHELGAQAVANPFPLAMSGSTRSETSTEIPDLPDAVLAIDHAGGIPD